MSVLVTVLTLLLLTAVMLVISGPLLRTARKQVEPVARARRRELLSARESKYREIRDAELDYRTGKLSQEDFEAVNGALRVEAIEILNGLEALEAGGSTQEPTQQTPRDAERQPSKQSRHDGDGEARPRVS